MVTVVRLGKSIPLRNEKKGGRVGRKYGASVDEWLLRQRFAIEGDREQARGGPDAHGPVAIPVRAGNSSSEGMGTAFCARWRLSYLLLVALHLWIPVPLLEGQKNLSSTVQKAGANADMNASNASNLLQLRRAQVCAEVVS